jgi:hypothetical protein
MILFFPDCGIAWSWGGNAMEETTVQEERDRRLGLWGDLERNNLTTRRRGRMIFGREGFVEAHRASG